MTPPRVSRRLSLGLLVGVPLVVLASLGADAAPNLAGTWAWEWKDGQGTTHRHVLVIDGTGKALAARERFDDQGPVKVDDLRVEGKEISFSVHRGNRRAAYTGRIADADTINGKVMVNVENLSNEFTWTAKREPTVPK